ncbi:hypothetical protein [Lutispora saccharofermentans]|uniref:Uncharacterized protein n=1 Tax=Lutispora saccharofermentans TaxID=3024236 RepID=A0ABT1NJ50_9FIRM|nr:hypothetical protein [Lutispora saccharofermentans]MCQ1530614.1 hypothetical protein [Lutispora saccharofermentans]
MKKIIAVLLMGILMLTSIMPIYGDDGSIKVSTEIGFNKVYRTGFTTPVTITVENNKKDIDGEIQIEIPSSAGPMGVETVNIYSININHPQNTVKKYTMNIPIPASLLTTKLRIVEGKKILHEHYMRIDMGIAENVMLAGVISDNPGNLGYMNGFTFKNLQGSNSMKMADLNEESFPVDLEVLNGFNAIIINDYDTSKLDEEQYKTLKRWVNQGGILILGTGPNGGKTLSVFKDDFMTGERGSLIKLSAAGLGALAGDGFAETIEVLDIKAKGGEALISENGINIAQQIDKGKGRILLLSFDMGLEPISSWKLNRYFMEALLQRAAPAVYSGEYFEKYMAMDRGYEYRIDRALRNIPELPLPGYKTIIILFAVYILLAAPVSYIALKKKDKRELMWAVVPALSVVFTVFIYFVGFGTRLTGPIFNKISVIYGDSAGKLTSRSFGGIFTPSKTDLKAEGVGGTKIRPLMRQSYSDSSYTNWEDKKVETKITAAPKASVEFYDIGVWSMKTLALDNAEDIAGSIKSEISYADSGFTGFVENSAGFDLEDCYIISSYQYMHISDIKNGEKKEISGAAEKYYGNKYDLMEGLYNVRQIRNRGQKLTDSDIAQLRKDNQKRDILEYYFSDISSGIEGIKLIGWTKAPIGGQVKINGKDIKSYEKSLAAIDMKLVMQPGEEVELPFGYIQPVIKGSMMNGNYDSYNNMYYGNGTLEVSFKIDENIEPKAISISYDKPEPNIKQYIWNEGIKDWEAGDFSSFEIEGASMEKYLDQSKAIRFMFEINGSEFRLPQISVKGSVK